jgi:hypothetical protein
MTIKDELLSLTDTDGVLHVEHAHAWAVRHPASELHSHLLWDDAKAGYQYRLWQIRTLIAIHVITPDHKREMISLSIDRTNGGGYRSLDVVMRNREFRSIALSDALAELERVQQKYSDLRELEGIWAAMENVKRKEDHKTPSDLAKRSKAKQREASRSTIKPSDAGQAKPRPAGQHGAG